MTTTLNYREFEKRCADLKLEPRVLNRGDYENLTRPRKKEIADDPPPMEAIERANRALFEKYCKAEGLDPAKTVTSPVLRKIIAEQNAKRAAIDAPEEK